MPANKFPVRGEETEQFSSNVKISTKVLTASDVNTCSDALTSGNSWLLSGKICRFSFAAVVKPAINRVFLDLPPSKSLATSGIPLAFIPHKNVLTLFSAAKRQIFGCLILQGLIRI